MHHPNTEEARRAQDLKCRLLTADKQAPDREARDAMAGIAACPMRTGKGAVDAVE